MAKFYAKAPDGSDALLSIVLTGFTQSLQQNGWCKLPNGLLFQWRGIGTDVYYQSPIDYNPDLRFNAFQVPYIIDMNTPFIYFGVDTGSSVLRCGLEINDDNKSHYFKVWVGIDNNINPPPYDIIFWVAVIGI